MTPYCRTGCAVALVANGPASQLYCAGRLVNDLLARNGTQVLLRTQQGDSHGCSILPVLWQTPHDNGGRAASSAALALTLAALVPLFQLAAILPFFYNSLAQALVSEMLIGVATLLPFAFLVALFRLPQVSWWRAFIETLAGIAVMQLVLLVGYNAMSLLLVSGIHPSNLLVVMYPVQVIMLDYVLPGLFASGLGFAIALLFAPWPYVRGTGRNGFLYASLGIVLGIVAHLTLNAILIKNESGLSVIHAPIFILGGHVVRLVIAVSAILAAALITPAQLFKVSVTNQ